MHAYLTYVILNDAAYSFEINGKWVSKLYLFYHVAQELCTKYGTNTL